MVAVLAIAFCVILPPPAPAQMVFEDDLTSAEAREFWKPVERSSELREADNGTAFVSLGEENGYGGIIRQFPAISLQPGESVQLFVEIVDANGFGNNLSVFRVGLLEWLDGVTGEGILFSAGSRGIEKAHWMEIPGGIANPVAVSKVIGDDLTSPGLQMGPQNTELQISIRRVSPETVICEASFGGKSPSPVQWEVVGDFRFDACVVGVRTVEQTPRTVVLRKVTVRKDKP